MLLYNLLTTHLDSIEQPKGTSARIVKVFLPLREGLETVHHGAIKSIRRGSDEEEHNPCVKRNEAAKNIYSTIVAQTEDQVYAPFVVLPCPVRVHQVVVPTTLHDDSWTTTHDCLGKFVVRRRGEGVRVGVR